jgi:hypothetical protein
MRGHKPSHRALIQWTPFHRPSNEYLRLRLLYPVCTRAGRDNLYPRKKVLMFLILAVVLVILWLGGFFVLHISSFLIHLLLIFAVISIIMNFVSGRRAV